MRVTKTEQQNIRKTNGVVKAGVAGGIAGLAVRHFAPLTTGEHARFFNTSARNAIQEKITGARINEANRIANKIREGAIRVNQDVCDVFVKNAGTVAASLEDTNKMVEKVSDESKEIINKIVSKIDMVGEAKRQIETNNIKSAAKSARPLACFVGIGALVAMGGKIIANTLNPNKSKEKPKKEEAKTEITMADLLLEGLGSNTEILFLTNEASNRKE